MAKRPRQPSPKRSGRDDRPQSDFIRPVQPPHRPAGPLERWAPGILISVVAAVAYIPSYDNAFVSWDDDHYLYNNQQVIRADGIKSVWGDVFYYSDAKYRGNRNEERVSHQYYPMVFTMYWLEFRLYSELFDEPTVPDPGRSRFPSMNPDVAAGFHVTSTVFHCLNVFLLITLLRALGLNTWVASVAAALFALTPVNVATVAWAAERKNILSLMFYMLSLLSYLRFRRRGGWYWYGGCIVLYQCALFSKTVALTLPVILVLTDRLIDGRWTLASVVRALPLVVLSGIAAWTTMEVEDRARRIPITDEQRPLVAPAAIWFYVWKSLTPVYLLPIYRLWDPSWDEFQWLVPLLGMVVAAWAVWHWRRRISGPMFWAMTLFLITQGPMLAFRNINYFQFAFVADHYFYNGGIGLFILYALLLDRLRMLGNRMAVRRAVTGGVVVVALLFAALTYRRCDDWQSVDTFWNKVISQNPGCWPAYYNLANERKREAMAAEVAKDRTRANELYDKAIVLYRNATEAKPDLSQAYDQAIGLLLTKRIDYAAAEELCRSGLTTIPQYPQMHYWMGVISARQKKYDQAEQSFLRALSAWRTRADVLVELGEVYVQRAEEGDFEKATTTFERAVEVSPRNAPALAALAAAYTLVGKLDEAVKTYERLIALQPKQVRAYLAISDIRAGQQRWDEAISWATRALKVDPDNTDAQRRFERYQQLKQRSGQG